MSNVSPKHDDEIDLLSLIQTILDGKWKIISIVAVFLLSAFCFNIAIPKTFTITTDIKKITSFEFDKYSLFNSSLKVIKNEGREFNIFQISPASLLNLYIEQIEERTLLEAGIDKYNLINKDDFDSESDYKEAIEKFASEIEILRPININAKGKIEKRLHHVLSAKYNDKNKWKELLSFVDDEARRKVQAVIINRFATVVSVQNQMKKFVIIDIKKKIDNVQKDYDKITNNKLAFLTEQAAIARKLNIPKNSNPSQRFNAQNMFVTTVKTDEPFYLRGYLAIEEEIKQITNRKDKDAFTNDLFKLEQQKRDLEQDDTIQRAVSLFNQTPLKKNDFQATIVKVATTNFERNHNTYLYYALATILGGVIGIVYVLITNAFRNRKTNTLSL